MFDEDVSRREQLRAEFLEAATETADAEAERYRAFRQKYRDDPAGFARDCVAWPENQAPTPYQEAILGAIPERRRVAVRSPHGTGKSCTASLAILWFALTRDAGSDWKCVCTASAWRQLEKYLLPELHLWAGRLRWDLIGREPFSTRHELLSLALKLGTGEAFAVASDDPGLVEGAHGSSVFLVVDEGKSVPGPMWDALEGALAGPGESFALAISTPGEPVGRFADIHHRRPGLEDWSCFHVTLEEAVAAGRISREWAEARAKQWGETSAVYLNRVRGEFASSDEDALIPLAWVEAANDRWHEWDGAGRPGAFVGVGVDVARSGRDQTVLALRRGMAVEELRKYTLSDTMQTTGHVYAVLEAFGGRAAVDVIGIGAGVFDRLREQSQGKGWHVVPFNASEATEERDRTGELSFRNKRSAAWWRLRELLDPTFGAEVALPPDDELTGDLTAPRWWINSSGKIQVEAKDEIRKRLGRSTDCGDAVVQVVSIDARPVKHEYRTVRQRRYRRPSRGALPRGWSTR